MDAWSGERGDCQAAVKYREAMLSAGQAYFYRVLSEANGDITRAAQIAGLNRTTLYKILPTYRATARTAKAKKRQRARRKIQRGSSI